MGLCGGRGYIKVFGWSYWALRMQAGVAGWIFLGRKGQSRVGWDGMYTFMILYFPSNQIEESKGTRER